MEISDTTLTGTSSLVARWSANPSGNAGKIITELSVHAGGEGDSEFRHQQICALICRLRSSAATKLPPRTSSLLTMEAAEFGQQIKILDDVSVKASVFAYEDVWTHQDIGKIFRDGRLHANDYPELDPRGLEQVGEIYLAEKWMQSPTLEWLLADALVFAEIVSFARRVYLAPDDQEHAPPSFWPRISSYLPWKSIAKEVLQIGATFFLAALIDPARELGYWSVAATITMIRWLRPRRSTAATTEQHQANDLALLNSMIAVHRRFYKPTFNARLVLNLLYDTERQGSFFCPMVFHTLDRRASR